MSEDSSTTASTNGDGRQKKTEKKNGHVQITAQYIRDLSFECPNIEHLISGPGDNPNLNVEINVNAKQIDESIYQSEIEFSATASSEKKVIYELELIYSGIFKLDGIPKETLEPLLLVNCPTILFPFMRRIVADLTRENGFPPLFLEPIDFAGLYIQRKKQEAE